MGEDVEIGTTIDARYTVLRFLGRGGMGSVYEAHHRGLDRKVAIKVFDRGGVTAAELERFRREARYASRIVHENVVQVFDFATSSEGYQYIVMEHIEGGDLAQVLQAEAPLRPDRAVEIARQMLLGLHAIHEQGIVHRDVKPNNVLLAKRGDRTIVKIADFGIARGTTDRSLTRTGHLVGTTQYMAPEQFRGDRTDRRADLYSVGITLYGMLAGKLPFAGNTAELAGQHVFSQPPALDSNSIPQSLVRAVMRSLAKSPVDRFPDALAFIEALDGQSIEPRQTVEDVSRSAPTVVERPRHRSPANRHRRWLVLMLSVVILGGAGIDATFVRRDGVAIDRSPHASPALSASLAATPAFDAEVPASDAEVPAPDAEITRGSAMRVDGTVATDRTRPSRPSEASSSESVTSRCACVPTNGPDVTPLCRERGELQCRCDDQHGRSLCPTPLVQCHAQPIEPELRRKYPHLCSTPSRYRCPDLLWDRYARPGNQDEPCEGYAIPRYSQPPSPDRVNGRLNCDLCPGSDPRAYRGASGAPCTGFHWRSKQQHVGTLQCE